MKAIIIILIAIPIALEFSTWVVYGGFISKEVRDVYMDLDESSLRLNQFNPSILSTNCYITDVPFSLFSKYHIQGLGTIPRWSPLHKRVKQYFAIAAKNGEKR